MYTIIKLKYIVFSNNIYLKYRTYNFDFENNIEPRSYGSSYDIEMSPTGTIVTLCQCLIINSLLDKFVVNCVMNYQAYCIKYKCQTYRYKKKQSVYKTSYSEMNVVSLSMFKNNYLNTCTKMRIMTSNVLNSLALTDMSQTYIRTNLALFRFM